MDSATTVRAPRRDGRRTLVGWLFIGPVMFGVVAFQVVPVLVSLYASLTDWTGLSAPEFNGIANYAELLTDDPLFWPTLRNTVVFTIGSLVLSIAFGLVLALLCNQRVPAIGLFKTAFFAPVVTNAVAIGFVWFWLYQPEDGLINGYLAEVGVDGPAWLSSNNWAMIAVIIVAVWQGVGYPMIILLAGLQGIPEVLYESAKLDGASRWAQVRYVTVPLLTPHFLFLMISQFITSFQVFGLIYVMTEGGPGHDTSVYIYNLYQNAFQYGKVGYACAMAWLLFVVIGSVTFLQWKLQNRWVFYE